MNKNITIVAPKGGVGKTTITANLAAAIASLGKKVLVVEGDRQNSIQNHFQYFLDGSSYNTPIDGGVNIFELSRMADSPSSVGVDILPYQLSSCFLEKNDSEFAAETQRTENKINTNNYDITICDTKTGSTQWIDNVIKRDSLVLICLNPEATSYSTLPSLLYAMNRKGLEGKACRYNILVNKMDATIPLCIDTQSVLKKAFGQRLLEYNIPIDPIVMEAYAKGKVLNLYSPHSKACTVIDGLADWIIKTELDQGQ